MSHATIPTAGGDRAAGLQARYPLAREVGRFLVVWRYQP